MSGSLPRMRFVIRLMAAVGRRPRLVPTALRQVVAMAPNRWWAERPRVPFPAPGYLEFRLVTATGTAIGPPDVHDTIVWLEWCRSLRALPAP